MILILYNTVVLIKWLSCLEHYCLIFLYLVQRFQHFATEYTLSSGQPFDSKQKNCFVPIRILSILSSFRNRISMSQIIICLKAYAKDSRMVFYLRLKSEVQNDARSNG